MAYARWSLARRSEEIRIRLHASEPLSEPDLEALSRDIDSHLNGDISTVVFTGRSTWVSVHRHADVAAGRWHVRSAVGSVKNTGS
jgi:hypothetical protein